MFDFTIQKRPCILYATDIDQYDRGYYFKFHELPFPTAKSQEELAETLELFDHKKYASDLNEFYSATVGLFEDGRACERIAGWIAGNSIN